MKIKSKFICIGLMLILVLSFVGCGFNEDKAKTDSKQALQAFLSSHNNKQVLVKGTGQGINKEKVKNYINKNFKNYFTSDFLNDTDNEIETGNLEDGKTFYIFENAPISDISFRNKYLINSPKVKKDDKTVEYKLQGNDGFAEYSVDIIMKQENGRWKIDKAN